MPFWDNRRWVKPGWVRTSKTVRRSIWLDHPINYDGQFWHLACLPKHVKYVHILVLSVWEMDLSLSSFSDIAVEKSQVVADPAHDSQRSSGACIDNQPWFGPADEQTVQVEGHGCCHYFITHLSTQEPSFPTNSMTQLAGDLRNHLNPR